MTEIKLYKSPWKAIRLLLLTLPFVIVGFYILSKQDSDRTMAWACICFFGLGIPLGLFNLFDRRPQIIIDEKGMFCRQSYSIFNKSVDKGFINWDAISNVYLKINKNSYRGLPLSPQKFICIIKKDNSRSDLGRKNPRSFGAFGLGDFNMPLLMTQKINEEKFVEFIKAMSDAGTAGRQSLLLITNF
jgi:hypothetical protein